MGIIYYKLLALFSTVLLSANSQYLHLNTIKNYSILVPNNFTFSRYNEPNHYDYFGYPDNPDIGISTIEFPNTTHPCNDTTLGVSTPITTHNGTTKWGEVDHNFSIYTENPVCLPPSVTEYDKENKYNGTTAFALCSEHQNKRVFICIAQQTPNFTQAKEIFESFRWLEPTDIFNDIPVTHTLATPLAYLKNKEIIAGYPDNTFQPQNPINRVEFLKILTLAADLEPKTCTMPDFPDTTPTAWYMSSLHTAYCHKIVKGYDDGTFKPENTINAAEMYKVVATAFNIPIPHGRSGTWYSSYERALQSIDAIPASIHSPSQLLTRGEMAEVVYRVMKAE